MTKMRVPKGYENLPKGLKEVGVTAERAIASLVKKGYEYSKAEDMVMEVLKESESYLKAGLYPQVVLSFKMIFDLK